MKKRTIGAFVIGALVLSGMMHSVRGEEGVAGVPGSYLYMGVGARALGMGGAYTAVANDASAVYWNPAGLGMLDPFQVSFMHANLFVDTSLDFLAGSAPTERYGSFGVAVLALRSGEFEQRTALNEVVGNFNTHDLALLVSWAKEVNRNVSVGLSYKFVNQKIIDYSGSGHGLDLGVKALLFDHVQAGLALRNVLSPKMKLVDESQSYPMQVSAGVASSFVDDKLLVSLELMKISGWGSPELRIGSEFKFIEQFAFRFGLSEQSVTFGAGFTLDALGVGYSNASSSDLGSSHRFGLTYSFSGFGLGADATPDVFSPKGELNITRIKLKVKSRADIENWSFAIVNGEQRIIREFQDSGQPPEEIVWDGRDNTGGLVADGSFSFAFQAQTIDGRNMNAGGALVTIDSQGPVGIISGDDDEE